MNKRKRQVTIIFFNNLKITNFELFHYYKIYHVFQAKESFYFNKQKFNIEIR